MQRVEVAASLNTVKVLVGVLTQQGVNVSLGVVEEASVPTDQVEGIDQVGATQVLRGGHGLGARPRYDQ